MPDNTLLMLFDEVRRKTLRTLDGVSETEALWVPAGLQNMILWHAGHCCVVVESLTMRALGNRPEIPPGWFELFGWESQPAAVEKSRWPRLADIVAQHEVQSRRLRPLIKDLTEEQLASPVPERSDRTVRYFILHGLYDEASHAGEIWLLRKIQEAG